MGKRSPVFSKFILVASVTAITLFGAAANASDPHMITASPVLPAGADMGICGSIESSAKYSAASTAAIDAIVAQEPQSYSTCMSGMLKEAQQINDMFTSGFSIAGAITIFSQAGFASLFNSLQNQVCNTLGGALHTVENGMSVGGSVTNLMGSTAGATMQFAIVPASSSGPVQNAGTMSPNDAAAQGDDLDATVNSGGATITATETVPSSGGALLDDNDTPVAPVPIAMFNAGHPGSTPMNATVCIPPDNKSYLSRSESTYGDSDSVTDTTLNPEADGLGADTGLGDDVPQVPNSPIIPAATLPPGQTASQTGTNQQASIPAANDGVIGCNPGQNASGNPGYISTGTPCTANAKANCMSGTGCSPQNGSIGVATNYQNNVFSHGPYGSGENKGQCAQLVQALVPNVGATGSWVKGAAVHGNSSLQFGTPIATFFGPGGVYKNPPNNIQHTGLYLGYVNSCMFMLEEWHSKSNSFGNPHERCLVWGTPFTGTANRVDEAHGANYYVVTH